MVSRVGYFGIIPFGGKTGIILDCELILPLSIVSFCLGLSSEIHHVGVTSEAKNAVKPIWNAREAQRGHIVTQDHNLDLLKRGQNLAG